MLSHLFRFRSSSGESLFNPAALNVSGSINTWIWIFSPTAFDPAVFACLLIDVSWSERVKLVKKIVLQCEFLACFTDKGMTS